MTDLRKIKSLVKLLRECGVVSYKEGDFEIILKAEEEEWGTPEPDTKTEYEIPWNS